MRRRIVRAGRGRRNDRGSSAVRRAKGDGAGSEASVGAVGGAVVRRNTKHLDTLWRPGQKRGVILCTAISERSGASDVRCQTRPLSRQERPMARTFVLLVLASLVGCADGRMTCRIGADCPSGICSSDGTCARPRDAGVADAPVIGEDGGGLDVPVSMADAGEVDGGGRTCSPDHDGVVTRAEVPLRPGLRATFRIAEDATVSTAGTVVEGARVWDFTGAYEGDADALVELTEPGGSWWAAEFPAATHATRLSQSSDNLGVFQITDEALLLLGVVSPADGFMRTRLTYDPPVTVIAFPLERGDTFSTTSTVSGQALGAIAAYTETYESVVDSAGTMRTPFGDIEVLRVRTEMERTSGLATLTTLRQYAFVGECFGTAGLVTSQAFETEVEFTDAAEIRRLAP
jgi:hypothetical protein